MLRAKFQCISVTKDLAGQEIVKFYASYASDGPNKAWSKATPAGALEMTISVHGAQGRFVPGKDYFLDFSDAT